MASAQRNAPLPYAKAVGNHKVGCIGSQRDDDDRLGRILGIVFVGRGQFAQLVEHEEVVKHQRRKLDDVHFDVGPDEGIQRAHDGVAFHGEQADLGFQGETFLFASAAHALVIPDHVVQVEGNLLPRFVADDVGDFLGLDRRQLDEPRQAGLARNRNRYPITLHRIARKKLLERIADQLGGIGARLTENFRILDVVECVRDDFIAVFMGATSHGL